jgi:hypothetical protein
MKGKFNEDTENMKKIKVWKWKAPLCQIKNSVESLFRLWTQLRRCSCSAFPSFVAGGCAYLGLQVSDLNLNGVNPATTVHVVYDDGVFWTHMWRHVGYCQPANPVRSKMATGTQTQTAWALWLRDPAEMLEPQLAEVKHQGELKLWHPETLACGRLLLAKIHWENKWVDTPMPPLPPAAGSKHAWETFSRPNRWEPSITQYPSATTGINQHNPPGQTDLPLQKKKKTLNKHQNWKLVHSRGWGLLKTHQRRGEGQGAKLLWTISKQMAGGLTMGGW